MTPEAFWKSPRRVPQGARRTFKYGAFCAILGVFLVTFGCVRLPKVEIFTQTGLASWYGEPFHGRTTANMEIYNMHGLTAAHRTLPLGTVIMVTDGTRYVVVRVNDRGPYKLRGIRNRRVLDLSLGAAKVLGMVRDGLRRVQILAVIPYDEKLTEIKGE